MQPARYTGVMSNYTDSPEDPIPPRTAPITEIYDWHYARSIAAGIAPYDAEILAEGFCERYAR